MVIRMMTVGAAVALVAVAGCSSKDSSTSSATSTQAGSTPTAVVVDGQKQNVTGAVSCTAADPNTNVAIGDPTAGVGAVVGNDTPPTVHSVGLGSVNGVTLGFSDAAGQGTATATKTGNAYKITGTAVGFDTANQKSVTKPFELDFTCT